MKSAVLQRLHCFLPTLLHAVRLFWQLCGLHLASSSSELLRSTLPATISRPDKAIFAWLGLLLPILVALFPPLSSSPAVAIDRREAARRSNKNPFHLQLVPRISASSRDAESIEGRGRAEQWSKFSDASLPHRSHQGWLRRRKRERKDERLAKRTIRYIEAAFSIHRVSRATSAEFNIVQRKFN